MRDAAGRSYIRFLLLFFCLLCLERPGLATTVILPPDDDLIIGARAIIRGRVTAIECGFDSGRERIFTYITVRVQEVIKGRIADRYVVIKESGGQVGTQGSAYFGTPQFARGERVLLYLDTWNDGSLRVHQMFLGKFSIVEDPATRREVAVRETPDAYTSVVSAAHKIEGTITNRMELAPYIAMLRSRIAATREQAEKFEQTYYRDAGILSAPPEYRRGAAGEFQPQYTLIVNPPARWFEPDEGKPVVFVVNTESAPNPQIMDDINAAMSAWSTVPGCSLRLANGGATSGCHALGTNTLVFNNCDSRFVPNPSCVGVLAIGGLEWNTTQTKVVGGKLFYRAHSGHVSFNSYSCWLQEHCNMQETATHELGHAVGLGHSWASCTGCPPVTDAQRDATMNGSAHFDGRCASIRQDDIEGIKSIYPAGGDSTGTLTIASPSPLPQAIVDRQYSQQLVAAGGVAPYSWSAVAQGGSLPAGLALTPGGVISGTPSSTGTSTFTAQVRDGAGATAQKTFSITVATAASPYDSQFVSQDVATTLKAGEPFSATIRWLNTGAQVWDGSSGFMVRSQNPADNQTWGGDRVPLYFYSVPPGQHLDLTLTAFSPREPGTYNFQWQLYQEGVGLFGQPSPNVTITVSGESSLAITSAAGAESMKGAPFNFQLAATGGKPPYSWAIASGSLPAGLMLNAAGVINGTPVDVGSASVMIKVSDSAANIAQKVLAITVLAPPIEVMTESLPSIQRGSPYAFQLAASGGKLPYTWQVAAGSLPPGLNLAPQTGVIAGTPIIAGSYGFIVEVRDSESRVAGKSLSIAIAAPHVALELATLVEAMKGAPFNYQPAASGGMPPFTWSLLSGALPPGVTLNTATGLISGAPAASGLFAINLVIRDQTAASASGTLQIKVIDPESIPAITRAKYKAGKKRLTVEGQRINPAAALFIDGLKADASFVDGVFTVKRLALAAGRHEIKIVNPGGLSSPPYALVIE